MKLLYTVHDYCAKSNPVVFTLTRDGCPETKRSLSQNCYKGPFKLETPKIQPSACKIMDFAPWQVLLHNVSSHLPHSALPYSKQPVT